MRKTYEPFTLPKYPELRDEKKSVLSLAEIEQALNLGRAEILAMYERVGIRGSNVLNLVTEVLDKVQKQLK